MPWRYRGAALAGRTALAAIAVLSLWPVGALPQGGVLSVAHATTPLSEVPFAGYGYARVTYECSSQAIDASGWRGECRLSGNLVGEGFAVSLDHAFHIGSDGCALKLRGVRKPVDIVCRAPWKFSASYVETWDILGTPCQAVGVLWSSLATTTEGEGDPPIHVIRVEIELLIKPGQASCEAGTWSETRYYLVCAERPNPSLSVASVNERVCRTGVELLTFEAVHQKPEGTDDSDPWHRRLFAQVRQ